MQKMKTKAQMNEKKNHISKKIEAAEDEGIIKEKNYTI